MITSRAIKEFDPVSRALCSIAAAVLGSSAISGLSSMWGASKASEAQTNAANASIANQRAMYEANKNLLSPFINAGQAGIGQLQDWVNPTSGTNPLASLIKLVTPGADMSAVLEQTPGYKFSQSQGTRAALNALAARGLGGSPGAIAKGVGGYVSGLASNTWDSVVKNLLSTFTSGGNALQNLVNSGINAGGALTGAGTNSANAISGALTGAGNAQAAGFNAMGSGIGNIAGSVPSAMLLQQLTGGSGGGGSVYGDPSFGGNNVWGGSSANPLPGLTHLDYGEGY